MRTRLKPRKTYPKNDGAHALHEKTRCLRDGLKVKAQSGIRSLRRVPDYLYFLFRPFSKSGMLYLFPSDSAGAEKRVHPDFFKYSIFSLSVFSPILYLSERHERHRKSDTSGDIILLFIATSSKVSKRLHTQQFLFILRVSPYIF